MPKRGDSVWNRAKKNLATRTLNSKLGRKSVASGLGNHENDIIAAIKSVVSLFKNDATSGRSAKKVILRTAAKVKIMDDNGIIGGPEVHAAAAPINEFGVCFLWTLERTVLSARTDAAKRTTIDVSRLVKLMDEVRKACLKVVRPLLTEKNLGPIDELLSMLGSEAFLSEFFNDQRYMNDRTVILHSLNGLLEPFSEHFDLERTCSNYGCVEQCCVVYGRYSEYCTAHHMKHVEEEMGAPSAKMWLTHGDKYQIFSQYLLAHECVTQNELAFLRAVDDFRQLDSAAAIHSRAAIIGRVYLKPAASKRVELAEDVVAEINEQLDSQATCNIFKPAVAFIMDRIDDLFNKDFLNCQEYSEYWELMQQTS